MKQHEWFNDYYKNHAKHERLGQAFVNDFIKQPWPELFYNNDIAKCLIMIENWLHQNQYYVDMPQKVQ